MNHQSIEISGTEIPVIEYKDERVITFRNIDRVHQRPEGTARKRFNDNKSRFIENEDFFNVPYDEWTQLMTVRKTDGHKGGLKRRIKFISLNLTI